MPNNYDLEIKRKHENSTRKRYFNFIDINLKIMRRLLPVSIPSRSWFYEDGDWGVETRLQANSVGIKVGHNTSVNRRKEATISRKTKYCGIFLKMLRSFCQGNLEFPRWTLEWKPLNKQGSPLDKHQLSASLRRFDTFSSAVDLFKIDPSLLNF